MSTLNRIINNINFDTRLCEENTEGQSNYGWKPIVPIKASPLSEIPQEIVLAGKKYTNLGVNPGVDPQIVNNSTEISKNSDAPAISKYDLMMLRVKGISPAKPTYKGFTDDITKYAGEDGKISRSERKAMGISKQVARDLNGKGDGRALANYTKGLAKRSYVDINSGKLIIEGEGDNYDPEAFETAFGEAKYRGANAQEAAKMYNDAVLDWRKNAEITYDPITGTYKTKGFGGTDDVDITNSAWAKDRIAEMTDLVKAQQNDYMKNIKTDDGINYYITKPDGTQGKVADWFMNDPDKLKQFQQNLYWDEILKVNDFGKYSADNLAGTLGVNLNRYNSLKTDEERTNFKKDYTQKLNDALSGLSQNADGTFNFQGAAKADAILNHLILAQQKGGLRWLGQLSVDPSSTYGQILASKKTTGPYLYLQSAKTGAVLRYIKKHKGGQSLDGVSLTSMDEPALWHAEQFDATEGFWGGNNTYYLNTPDGKTNGYYEYTTPTAGVYMYVPTEGGNAYFSNEKLSSTGNTRLGDYIVGHIAKGDSSEHDLWSLYSRYRSANEGKIKSSKAPALSETSTSKKPISNETLKKMVNNTYTPYQSIYTEPYTRKMRFNATYKQGGNLNMNKINYFLAGGPAPAAAPAQGGEDMQAQIVQLVQAAMSGDEQATQTINQIMQAAQQGDQQATQIAQMIQEVAQQMQGQAQAAKRGAKLAYIHSLRTGCPEGTEAVYTMKKGGVCKACVKKAEMEKCGGKTKKHQKGGPLTELTAKAKGYIVLGKALPGHAQTITPVDKPYAPSRTVMYGDYPEVNDTIYTYHNNNPRSYKTAQGNYLGYSSVGHTRNGIDTYYIGKGLNSENSRIPLNTRKLEFARAQRYFGDK